MHEDEPETITLKNRFLTIATAKVATSAFEGFDIGVFRKGHDEVVLNQSRRIAEAKRSVIEISDSGYTTPVQRKDIKVLGALHWAHCMPVSMGCGEQTMQQIMMW